MLASEERKDIDSKIGNSLAVNSPEGIPIFEELWLMCNADVHCTLGREGGDPNKQKDSFIFNFSCPALNINFISPIDFPNTNF